MKRKCLHASPCPIARALDSIGDWWTLLILRDAFKEVRRFNAFQKNLGIPRNILTSRLRMLVERDILATVPASDGSVYHEYVLTEKGRDLIPVLLALRRWGERHVALTEDDMAAAAQVQAPDMPAGERAHGDAARDDAGDGTAASAGGDSGAGAGQEDELSGLLEDAAMQSPARHAEGGRLIDPGLPRAAY